MEKVSPAVRKSVHSLATSKGRRTEGAFVTERTKNVLDLLEGPFALRWLVATTAWFENHGDLKVPESKCLKASTADMERMTSLSTAPDVLAVFELPQRDNSAIGLNTESLYLALDGIQDPGNMGTIVRLADWFGVDTILAGNTTVDVFNPKCVISTMGSIARVKVVYCNLPTVLNEAVQKGISVWGTFLDGENIYDLPEAEAPSGIIVMGNEGNGISDAVAANVTKRLLIPAYPPGRSGAESLNVAMATAITLAEFRRRDALALKR